MGEYRNRIAFVMNTFGVAPMTDGSISIENYKTCELVRRGLTADDEPMDIADDMNVCEVLKAVRDPSPEMIAAGKFWLDSIWLDKTPFKPEDLFKVMIDAALKESPRLFYA